MARLAHRASLGPKQACCQGAKSYIILKGYLGVTGKQAWVSPEVSGGPGYRDIAIKKALWVTCREGLRRNLFTFLLAVKGLLSPSWLVGWRSVVGC